MKLFIRTAAVLAVTIAVWSAATLVMAAEPGDLDTNFSNDGKVLRKLDDGEDRANAVEVLPNGKILTAGTFRNVTTGNDDVFVMRLKKRGGLDHEFNGGSGVNTLTLPNMQDAADLAVLSNDKIIVAGTSDNGPDTDIFVARFNRGGTLDMDYGPADTGYVTHDLGGTEVINGLTLQEGKPVVAGSMGGDVLVARLTGDGDLDDDFSQDGYHTVDFGGASDFAGDVVKTHNGKILFAGATDNGTGLIWALGRLGVNGGADNDFGQNGQKTLEFFGKSSSAHGLALQDDRKIIVCGSVERATGNQDFAIARLGPNGSLDNNFGDGGSTLIDLGSDDSDLAQHCALQGNGKIVGAGRDDDEDGNIAAVRLKPSGARDGSFGRRGVVRVSYPLSSEARAFDMRDGKLVLVGLADDVREFPADATDADVAVAKLHL